MNKTVTILVLVLLSSCSLFTEFRKHSFDPKDGAPFQLQVPKKWSRSTLTPDSGGGSVRTFYYADGSAFYITDTGKPFSTSEQIDTANHIALSSFGGGVMYKGVMPGLLYWREIQRGAYRFGYRNVVTEYENRFDSALNYAAQMRPVR